MESPDQPVAYIESITRRYANLGYTPYRWFEAEDAPPFAPLKKPLSESKLGLLTTSGCYVAGQVAFHYKDDSSIRRIAVDTPADRLRFSHITENYLVDARNDPECLVPLAALHQLVQPSAAKLRPHLQMRGVGRHPERQTKRQRGPQCVGGAGHWIALMRHHFSDPVESGSPP